MESAGAAFHDKVVEPFGRGAGLIESDSDRIAAAIKRIEEATRFPRLRIPDESFWPQPRPLSLQGNGSPSPRSRSAALLATAREERQLPNAPELPLAPRPGSPVSTRGSLANSTGSKTSGLRQQLTRLRAIAAEVRGRLSVTKDTTRRLTLEDQLLGIYREQRSVQEQITDQIKTANAALKERADAIKSAVLEKLQRRQTSILNQRAIAEAKEQLRIARQLRRWHHRREATVSPTLASNSRRPGSRRHRPGSPRVAASSSAVSSSTSTVSPTPKPSPTASPLC